MVQTQNDNIYPSLTVTIPPPPALTFTQTSAMASTLVLKDGPGTLYSCTATTNSASGYLMLFDALDVPPDGVVTPRDVVYCNVSSTSGIDQTDTPEAYAVGIIAVFSSTGPYVKTATAGAFIKGIVL